MRPTGIMYGLFRERNKYIDGTLSMELGSPDATGKEVSDDVY